MFEVKVLKSNDTKLGRVKLSAASQRTSGMADSDQMGGGGGSK